MGRRGSFRASDEDRERIIERLHKAATEGRIAAEELEHRVSSALKARTYDELDSTVADLPVPRGRGRHEPEHRSAGRRVVSTVTANPILLLFAIPVLAVSAAMLLAVTMVWFVLMVVVLVLGGRPRVAAPPWAHARRHLMGGRRRGAGGYWA
jgi:cation transport ATPase